MKSIGIGIVGTGSIAGDAHAPAVGRVGRAHLTGVLSRSAERGSEFLSAHGALAASPHTKLESFCADPNIDLAIICTPDRLHAEQARACLKAGKHVLLEKPLAVSEEEAQELIEIAAAGGVRLATGFHLRSHFGHELLYKKIRMESEIGELRHIRVVWAWPASDARGWRAGASLGKWWSLAAVGTHCLDLARWFGGNFDDWKQFAPVIATNVWGGPHDETAVLAGQFSSGTTVEVVSSVQFGPYARVELFGSKGSAVCDGTLGRAGAGRISLNGEDLAFEPMSPFVRQLSRVVDAILDGGALPADGEDGRRGVKDLLLAYDV